MSNWVQRNLVSNIIRDSVIVCAAMFGMAIASPAVAEGVAQIGLNQRMIETHASVPAAASNRDILVDILTAGEVINIAACGASNAEALTFIIENPAGTIVANTVATATEGKIDCADFMTAPITTPYRYTTTVAGKYKVRLINTTANILYRYDITVTANSSINPDPTGATGIVGRVSSINWQYSTGSATATTDGNYFILVPGGYPGTNYVWQLDLNQMAGQGYNIFSSNLGVAAPRSGFSTQYQAMPQRYNIQCISIIRRLPIRHQMLR
jgi:hypothetical protein